MGATSCGHGRWFPLSKSVLLFSQVNKKHLVGVALGRFCSSEGSVTPSTILSPPRRLACVSRDLPGWFPVPSLLLCLPILSPPPRPQETFITVRVTQPAGTALWAPVESLVGWQIVCSLRRRCVCICVCWCACYWQRLRQDQQLGWLKTVVSLPLSFFFHHFVPEEIMGVIIQVFFFFFMSCLFIYFF